MPDPTLADPGQVSDTSSCPKCSKCNDTGYAFGIESSDSESQRFCVCAIGNLKFIEAANAQVHNAPPADPGQASSYPDSDSTTHAHHWRTSHGMVPTDKPMRERDPEDHYPTPDRLCLAALKWLDAVATPTRVLDPGCGTGPWGRAARTLWPTAHVTGLDINGARMAASDMAAYDELHAGDFRQLASSLGEFDTVIANPPFSLAEEFLHTALSLLQDGGDVLFLLRLAFLESEKRYSRLFSWQDLRPIHVAALVERPSFTGDGKVDSTAYALFHWKKGARIEATTLSWLAWKHNTVQLRLFEENRS